MADSTIRTYDPKEVLLTFGTTTFSGFAEGSFIKIDRSGDLFTTVKGADGGVDRVNNNNSIFTVEVTLKQTSPTNEQLAAVAIADSLSNAGVAQMQIKDLRSSRSILDKTIEALLPKGLNGDKIVFLAEAWISKDPETEYSDTMTNRVWTFTCSGVKMDSGNAGAAPTAIA